MADPAFGREDLGGASSPSVTPRVTAPRERRRMRELGFTPPERQGPLVFDLDTLRNKTKTSDRSTATSRAPCARAGRGRTLAR